MKLFGKTGDKLQLVFRCVKHRDLEVGSCHSKRNPRNTTACPDIEDLDPIFQIRNCGQAVQKMLIDNIFGRSDARQIRFFVRFGKKLRIFCETFRNIFLNIVFQ